MSGRSFYFLCKLLEQSKSWLWNTLKKPMKNPDDKASLLTLCKACELLIYSNTEYGNLTKY